PLRHPRRAVRHRVGARRRRVPRGPRVGGRRRPSLPLHLRAVAGAAHGGRLLGAWQVLPEAGDAAGTGASAGAVPWLDQGAARAGDQDRRAPDLPATVSPLRAPNDGTGVGAAPTAPLVAAERKR